MKVHELKTWPEPFDLQLRELKPYEYRIDDGRGFEVGDVLLLREWCPVLQAYLGRALRRQVTCVTRCEEFGGTRGHVVLGVAPVPADPTEPNPLTTLFLARNGISPEDERRDFERVMAECDADDAAADEALRELEAHGEALTSTLTANDCRRLGAALRKVVRLLPPRIDTPT